MAKEYGSKDIQVLEGLEAVRMRPGMYIGSTGTRGLHHLIWEIVDNAIDEAANGYASEITRDAQARTVPACVDGQRPRHARGHRIPTLGVSGRRGGVHSACTRAASSTTTNYAYSGGLHGVGASVVNALSKWLVVRQLSSDLRPLSAEASHQRLRRRSRGKILAGRAGSRPLEKLGGTRKRGTQVTFLPDDTVCSRTSSSTPKRCARRLRELAYLNQRREASFSPTSA